MRAAVALLLLGPLLPAARAGGGPETTLVIVNADSPVSRRVANEYIALRKIPATNLVYLPDIPGRTVIEVDVFRRRIWKPVLAYLEQHGLANRIETIAYSADFPYGVDFRADAGRAGPAVGSLTGLTFLADRVMHKDLRYAALQSNPYFQPVGGPARRAATDEERQIYMEAFMAVKAGNLRRAAQLYGRFCESFPEHAEAHYNRACCLARLNRNEDALAALRAAVEAGWSDSGHTERDADLAGLRSLPEFRGIVESMGKRAAEAPPALGFAAARKEAGGALDRTYLAVMLGYTGVRGNSVPEILTYLRAAAMSDGTRPEGTVYICKNGDIRSRTREPFFASTVAALQRLGRRAEILEPGKDGQTGVLPVGKKDVIGAVIGKAGFSWKSSNSRILPGAICEHLTSFGAAFRSPGQTKLSELLRYGAAGTSGTVVEPMAIWRKFPHPFLHAYYAEGCSLAEAFYQSVAGPYQLLIVGDPLARPFAHFARAKLDKPSDLLPWKGKVRIQARVEPAENRAVARVELWVDGRFI
ncbi:MAG: tetratricopeptide repeat protein, partial [Planctomycetota bacterium]